MSTTFSQIPIIDFAPFINGDANSKNLIANQVNQACQGIGFMYIKNTGISENLIKQVFREAKIFFALPITVKNQLAWSDEFSNRGYVGIERERLNPEQPGDLKEAFNVGKEDNSTNFNFGQNNTSLICNPWPSGEENFRETVLNFYQACTETANIILEAFAIALQQPTNFFTNTHTAQNHTLRLLHYPPLQQTPKPGQVRAGEHSDYGSITLLFQDEIGGLEVCTTAGKWIAAPTIPDTILVNTGDLMQRWTNHVFCSTKHRVMIPEDEKKAVSRYSIAFFCHPNDDTLIEAISSCVREDFPQLYPPISAGDYLLSRLQATY
ncbi:isopenicillin N synthase family dioxygenase [Floridanema aerugineum]|uniref:Isopenicillin N synthase family dioxygenase n=1 Tax=Floridaenema aerugineum BLCC-F46 TaxID=3153654 RepID=A0ABV4XBJ4_9CYAN